jgi:pseudaminic acid biosynthesis-associated methylase
MGEDTSFGTQQEAFWSGDFGDVYVDRNTDAGLACAKAALFARILSRCEAISSLVEFGPNVGLNLRALRTLLHEVDISAVEINQKAFEILKQLPGVDARHESLLEFQPDRTWDLALSCGVLIHLAPDRLPDAYRLLHQSAARYIVVAEYYNPTPVEVTYRGHEGKLFKRDFAGEMLDLFSDLHLRDYGFVYHRDPLFPLDDVNWFLLEKC